MLYICGGGEELLSKKEQIDGTRATDGLGIPRRWPGDPQEMAWGSPGDGDPEKTYGVCCSNNSDSIRTMFDVCVEGKSNNV